MEAINTYTAEICSIYITCSSTITTTTDCLNNSAMGDDDGYYNYLSSTTTTTTNTAANTANLIPLLILLILALNLRDSECRRGEGDEKFFLTLVYFRISVFPFSVFPTPFIFIFTTAIYII